jgi:BirA family biotin operon repressor/biotin-[acetyl-CoA-carboxylase] ligase
MSLRALTGSAPDPALFVEQLAASLGDWIARWRSGGLTPIRAAWLSRAHPIGTALSSTDANGRQVEGLFDGLDDQGALRLRLAEGSVMTIQAGDVFLI